MDKLGFSDMHTINQIIVNLYDSEVHVHTRVVNFLESLAGVIQFDKSFVFFFYENNGTYVKHSDISVSMDGTKEDDDSNSHYYDHIKEIYPFVDHKSPITFKGSEFFNLEKRKDDENWNKYYLPHNFYYSIDGNLLFKSNVGLKGGICLYRGVEKIDFNKRDVEILALLLPHLAKILNYYDEEDDSTNAMFMFEKCEYIGFALLDENCEVIRSNTQYRRITSFPDVGKRIQDIIHGICMDIKADSGDLESFTKQYKLDDAPFFVEVSKTNTGPNKPIQFFCVAYHLSCFFDFALNQLREGHKLTTREFNILLATLHGKSNEEIANELYLSLPTVKKYLASIYTKLEIKNQKQILEILNIH